MENQDFIHHPMVIQTYLFIISFFLLGALAFLLINRNKTTRERRRSWTKYITYFIIIHLVFFSIVFHQLYFRTLVWIILVAGFLEIFNLFRGSGKSKRKVFISSLIIYLLLSASFFYFGRLSQGLILFTFLVTAGFDAFSQIAGQLMGRHYLAPKISPKKTFEGCLGGALIAIVAAFLLRGLVNMPAGEIAVITTGIVIFAFSGDIFFSWYKRQYKVKDFSNVLPGHGGFLDRFDSLIAAGAFISLYSLVSFL